MRSWQICLFRLLSCTFYYLDSFQCNMLSLFYNRRHASVWCFHGLVRINSHGRLVWRALEISQPSMLTNKKPMFRSASKSRLGKSCHKTRQKFVCSIQNLVVRTTIQTTRCTDSSIQTHCQRKLNRFEQKWRWWRLSAANCERQALLHTAFSDSHYFLRG